MDAQATKAMFKLDTWMLAVEHKIDSHNSQYTYQYYVPLSFIKHLYSTDSSSDYEFLTIIAESLIKILSSVSFIKYMVSLDSMFSVNKCVPIELFE